MRAQGVLDVLPVPQLAIALFHFQGTGRDLVELSGVGAVVQLAAGRSMRSTM
jgi:hypothetical protein